MMNIDRLYQSGHISEIDRAFAEMLNRRLGGIDPWVAAAAALVSRTTAFGDVCLDLAALTCNGYQAPDSPEPVPMEISLDAWKGKLTESPAVDVANGNKPLVLDGSRLYLQRYWAYEQRVARGILERCRKVPGCTDLPLAPAPMDRDLDGDRNQQEAIKSALTERFTVISGGPGTGKTFTISRIILALFHLNPERFLRIKVAAPTGKAAARLQEALDQSFAKLQDRNRPAPADLCRAQTIHRLLGSIPGKNRFRYHAQNPLPADTIIVDEASMIDLALMAKLMEAIPLSARLILVGDKDQLASVEAGAVLGDICGGLNASQPEKKEGGTGSEVEHSRGEGVEGPASHIIVLKKSYRFGSGSGIEALGAAVNAGDGDRALALLTSGHTDIVLRSFASRNDMEKALDGLVMEAIAPAFELQDPREVLQQFNQLKFLTPLRRGPAGVVALNHQVERILTQHDVIESFQGVAPTWYAGRPVMVTRNDYYNNLFNGDVGTTVAAGAGRSKNLKVLFPDSGQGVKLLTPEQLPPHETVYAMTVHKSQGTEFEKVVMVLPAMDVPLMTRELIYTAITRARSKVEIWGRPDLLKTAISRRIRRISGLYHILWRNGLST